MEVLLWLCPQKGTGGDKVDKYLFLREMNRVGFESQKKFAEYIGVSEKTLNNHLNNITKVNTEDAAKYCKALKIEDSEKIVRIFFTQHVPEKGQKGG